MRQVKDFFNLYRHGFARVAVATPLVRVADPQHNARGDARADATRGRATRRCSLVVSRSSACPPTPATTCSTSSALLDAAEEALARAARAHAPGCRVAALVGLPLRVDGRLYNCAALVCRGRLLGVVPKTYLPNYREFYEARQFTPGDTAALRTRSQLAGQRRAVRHATCSSGSPSSRGFVLHVEICEDLWVPMPPSSYAALAGATVLANLSASNIMIGKEGYRRQLVGNQSARCLAAYLYSAAGLGESTTDLAWDGHALIYENGTLLAESKRFADEPQLAAADVDLERLAAERMRQNTFGAAALRHHERRAALPQRRFLAAVARAGSCSLERRVERFPTCRATRDARRTAARRSTASRCRGSPRACAPPARKKLVIGVSGGLDSTQALLVCARAMDRAEAAAQQHPRLHHAGLRHQRAHARTRPGS